jgi:hypothetical protein
MDDIRFRIIREFAKGLSIELTINQISKMLKVPYASANKYCHELISQGILIARQVGPSLVCKLDFSNNAAQAALAYLSISSFDSKTALAEGEGIAISYRGSVYHVSDQAPKKKGHIARSELIAKLKEDGPGSMKVLRNAEGFWKAVAEAAR